MKDRADTLQKPAQSLADLSVLELGDRTACRISGSLFAQFGAKVTAVERADSFASSSVRSQLMAGKQSLLWAPGDEALCQELAEASDVVLFSSDQPIENFQFIDQLIDQGVCLVDITSVAKSLASSDAWGASDLAIQACSGMLETTGMSDGPACAIDGEPLEHVAALHAFSGAVSSIGPIHGERHGEHISVNLMDCAFAAHSIFLSNIVANPDAPARRSGNRHLLASPWNVFKARDSWLLVCMATDVQWQRFCVLSDNPELAEAAQYATGPARLGNLEAVESVVQRWVNELDAADVSRMLLEINIPCGPVAPVEGYPREPNLDHRQLVTSLHVPGDSETVYGTGKLLHATQTPGLILDQVPMPDDGRGASVEPAIPTAPSDVQAGRSRRSAPLEGMSVLELGHFTTAPLAARYLSQLGADVIKVETPAGEASRHWQPQRHGMGVYFVVTNTGKQSVALNLKQPEDLARLEQLVTTADVLIENLKPGALQKMGLSFSRMQELNPKLVYCAVSGFGVDSIYPGRPAYDTVIQAMAGVMDRTRAEGVPIKTGMSAADVMGANFAIGAIVAMVRFARHCNRGQFVDISMQDVAAWSTQLTWNNAVPVYERSTVLACPDGAVMVELAQVPVDLARQAPTLTRTAIAERWPGVAWPVVTMNEALAGSLAGEQVLEVADARGNRWPVMLSPVHFSRCSVVNQPILSELGGDNERYF